MTYTAYDYDGYPFETGKNSTTKEECIEEVFELLYNDSENYEVIKNWSIKDKEEFLRADAIIKEDDE